MPREDVGVSAVPSPSSEIRHYDHEAPEGSRSRTCTPAQLMEALPNLPLSPSMFADVKALIQSSASTGRKCYFPSGIYPITERIQVTVATDFEIVCDTGAVFVVDADFPVDTQVFVFIGEAGANHRFKWSGGVIDGRLMPTKVGVAAPDLLSVSGTTMNEVLVENVYFLQNESRTSGTAGDSCLFLTEGQNYTVRNCKFQGAVDAAIYISGNAAETAGSKCHVTGNTFTGCNVAYIAKRSFQDQIIDGNFFEECNYGVVVGGEADTTLLPGKKGIITHNSFKKCLISITARIADGTIITANRIEDFAVDSTLTPTTAPGISIEGSSNCIVSNNYISVINYTPAINTDGVRINDFVYDGTTYHCSNNFVDGNVLVGLPIGIKEYAGSIANVIGVNNQYINCTARNVLGGTGSFSGHHIYGDEPQTLYHVQDGAADEKIWRIIASDDNLSITARNDDGTVGSVVLQAFRTGGMITQYIMQLQGFPNHADDAAAAAGGVPVSGMYRTGSTIKIRTA